MAKSKPIHEIRLGRIRAAIWENETKNGSRHNVSFSRLYKDGDQWKDSTSFGSRRSTAGRQGFRPGTHVDLRACTARQYRWRGRRFLIRFATTRHKTVFLDRGPMHHRTFSTL